MEILCQFTCRTQLRHGRMPLTAMVFALGLIVLSSNRAQGALIFEDNFESWVPPNGSWTARDESAGPVSVVSRLGNSVLECSDRSATQSKAYLVRRLTPISTCYVRFYFYLPDGFWDGFSTTQYQIANLFSLSNEAGQSISAFLENSRHLQRLRVLNSSVVADVCEGQWHSVEILAPEATTATATVRWWFDGVEQGPATISLALSSKWNQLTIGLTSNVTSLQPTVYYDEVAVADSALGAKTVGDIFIHEPAVYYVDGTRGDDSRDGKTAETAWKTLYRANHRAYPGDTILIRGGEYLAGATFSLGGSSEQMGIRPERSGRPGKPITYRNYDYEHVRIRGGTAGAPLGQERLFGIQLYEKSYIRVVGLDFYELFEHLQIRNGHYNEIAYCRFDRNYNYMNWSGSRVWENSSYNHVHHCVFSNYGKALNGDDTGVTLEIGNESSSTDFTSHNLIEECHIFHGGHHVLALNGSSNVARNNYLHNEEWMEDESGRRWGNRTLYMVNTQPGGCNQRNLIENNRMAYSAHTVDGGGLFPEGIKVAHSYNLIRKNWIYQMPSSSLSHQYYRPAGGSRSNHDYHNTIYRTDLEKWRGAVYFNSFQAEEPWIRDNIIKNNIILEAGTLNPGTGSAANTYLRTLVEGNYQSGDALFVSAFIPPLPMEAPQPDFHLRDGSPCIDRALFLTRVASANGSGTQFQVADAGYFMDGWGIVAGDLIRLAGPTRQEARITHVDYAQNMLRVDRPVTWVTEQGVSLSYEGAAPDVGACENGQVAEAPSAAPPVVASPNPAPAGTTRLIVLGAGGRDEANLTYTWTTLGTPPAPVSIAPNGTYAAKSAIATFAADGTYHLRVTIRAPGRVPIDSPLTVTVAAGLRLSQAIAFRALPYKAYGFGDFQPGATASSGLPVSYSSSNPAVATLLAGRIHITGPGTSTITASQPGDATYSPAVSVTQTLTVARAALTIKANDEVRQIGQRNPAFDATPSGLSNGDTLASIGLGLSYTCAAGADSVVGTYPITPSGAALTANYSVTYQNGNLTVTDKTIPVITWAKPLDITYGTKLTTLQLNASSGGVSGTFTYSPPLYTMLYAGNAQILRATFNPTDNSTYAVVSKTVTINVLKKPLTVVTHDKQRLYGTTDPVFTAEYVGLANLDSPARLNGSLSFICPALPSSPAGVYGITPSGLSSPNYAITYVSAALNVARAALTVKANNKTRNVGEPNPAFDVVASGLVNGDTLASIGLSVSLSCTADELSAAGTYPITPTAPAYTTNYAIRYEAGILTVNGTPPVITTQPVSRTVKFGRSASFAVTASGASPLSYQWKKNAVAIPGANSATYVIASVSSSDAAAYTVTVADLFGSATSSAAFLTVTHRPRCRPVLRHSAARRPWQSVFLRSPAMWMATR